MMKHLDLFSGIGGFALAAQMVYGEGYVNVAHSEISEFCCAVYHRHFSGSMCLGNISKIDWSCYANTIDILTGGFPCQPYSVAGKQKGKKDNRALWHEMRRTIALVKPRWVIAENVPGIISMELDEVLSDLENENYETGTLVIPACAVGAPHRRDRVWIIANTNVEYREKSEQWYKLQKKSGEALFGRSVYDETWQACWTEAAARFCGVDDGISNRVDRIKALGNSIVPQIAEMIFRAIKYLEEISNAQELHNMSEHTYEIGKRFHHDEMKENTSW